MYFFSLSLGPNVLGEWGNDGVKTQPDDVVHVQLENWRDFCLIFHLEAQTELGGLQEADRAGGGEDDDEGGGEALAEADLDLAAHTLGRLATGNPWLSLSSECRPS